MEENRSAPDFKGLNANYHGGRGGGVGISRPLLDEAKHKNRFARARKEGLTPSRHSRLLARGLGRGSTY